MSTVDQAAELLARMTSGEKVQLFQLVASELGAGNVGIESRPEVCGGEPCIVRTRIPVWVLEQSRRLGATEADLLVSYPTLQAGDLLNARVYAEQHRDAIDEQISDNCNLNNNELLPLLREAIGNDWDAPGMEAYENYDEARKLQ